MARKTDSIEPMAYIYEDGQVLDIYGSEVELPRHKVRAMEQGKVDCYKLIATKSGGTQLRAVDRTVYDDLRAAAAPVAIVANHTDEGHADVEQFIADSILLRPESLIISDLKWRYLMRSVVRGKNIMMTGPSGCGKTLAVQSVSKALADRPYFYFNLGATTDPRSTLIGNTHYSKDKGTFVADSLFVQAIQQPNAIVLMDELTRATPDAWNILITVLDENQRYLRIDEHPDTPTIRVAKGVTFIATANIGNEYTGTRVLDRAMLDRFSAIVEMEPLTVDEEARLIRMVYPDLDKQIVKAISEIAAHTRTTIKQDDARISTTISSRLTVEMAGLVFDGFSLGEAAEVCIYPFYSDAGGVDSERTYMKQLVQKYLGNDASDTLYKADDTPSVSF